MAAPVLAFENLGLIQGSGWLFRNLDVFVGARDRLAFIGRNGAGKTTLFRLLAGQIEADEGRRTIVPGTRVVLLDQDPSVAGFATLRDFALAGGSEPHEVEAIADGLGIDLGRDAATASGGERRRAAIARALALDPQVLLLDEPTNHLDLAAIDWLEAWLGRYKGAFIAISHDRTFLTRLTSSTLWLDRGTMRRKEIGFGGFDTWTESVFAEEARNAERLDAKLKLELHWLERGVTARRKRNQGRLEKLNQMRAQRAAMLGPPGTAKLGLANDDVRSKSVIVAEGVSKSFSTSGLAEPVEACPERLPQAGSRRGVPSSNPRSCHTEKGRASTGSAKTVVESDPSKSGLAELVEALPSSSSSGRSTDEKKGNLSTSSGKSDGERGRPIIRDFSLRVQRGDRIGLVGANGAGKTTLLKLLTGEIAPDAGTVTIAKTLTGVVIDQQRKLMAPEKTVRDVLTQGGDWIDVRGVRTHLMGYLKDFLFDPGISEAKVGALSGGERSRLLLAREFARASNLLVLDEPTNDLDLETLDLLQDVIADYDGTVLIVSHDRDFLDKTVTLTLGLDGSGKVDIIAGGYEDWERKRRAPAQAGAQRSGSVAELPPAREHKPARARLTYKDQRDYDGLPQRIEEIEAAIARDEAALADPDLYARDPQKFEALTQAIGAARGERDAAEERWLMLAEMVEAAG